MSAERFSPNGSLGEPSVPEGWAWTRVSTLGEMNDEVVKTGPFGAILKSKEFVSTGVPVLAVGNVQSGHLDLSDMRLDHVTEMKAEELSDYRLQAGDVLFTRSGTIGRSAVVPPLSEGWLMSYHLLRVRPDQRIINPQYLYYVFAGCQASRRYTNDATIGTTRPGINTQILRDVPIPLAPRPEQDRVVAAVDQLYVLLDATRERLSKVGAILKRFRQAVLAAACSGRLTEDWRGATQKSNELPPGWTWRELGGVLPKGAIFDGPFGSNLKTADYIADGVRVIRLENIGRLSFRDSKRVYISEEKYHSLEKHTVKEGDIIFSSFIDDAIRTCVLPNLHTKAIAKADCFCLRPIPDVNPHYLTLQLSSEETYDALVEAVHGATRPRVNTTQLKRLAVRMCSLPEQHEIVRRVQGFFTLAQAIEKRVATASAWVEKVTDALLKRAFRGELVPTEAELAHREGREYEPASSLLERIKREREIKVQILLRQDARSRE